MSRINQTYTGDGSTGTANVIQVNQGGSQFQRNTVGNSLGFDPDPRGIYQTGSSNFVDIDQVAANNDIFIVTQTGVGNSLTASQTGLNNLVEATLQVGNSNSGSLIFNGNFNGRDGFSIGSDADSVGVATATLTQLGDFNVASLETIGNDNEFGFYQDGDSNTATGTQTGDLNQVAVSQIGTLNVAAFTQTGNGNNAGISQ
ncbi:hypothetical protein ATO6_12350 [Oceanicola sp. 22II-s10i]|nr:hypothetical protein ATO6_12350 [Oceanicola sp. 22II-s10i]